jgi:2-polyprenyl-3-methyl-5-hydroxy-6-metoxy-1,4-benzoquinol methylase
MIKSLIDSQRWLSYNFDKLLSKKYRIDGNQDFIKSVVPKYLKENIIIYDIGGGKNPNLSCEKKKTLNATVVGLDIDEEELRQAPEGAYDKTICVDIARFRGNHDADLVICQALLEHVKDVESAFAAISSILKPGGLSLIFVPSRYAIYARLNIILPEKPKKVILDAIHPATKKRQGFRSYYNKCTPLEFKQLADSNGLSFIEERYYFISDYFSVFFPAYLVWRLWLLIFHTCLKDQAAETFSVVLRKDDS